MGTQKPTMFQPIFRLGRWRWTVTIPFSSVFADFLCVRSWPWTVTRSTVSILLSRCSHPCYGSGAPVFFFSVVKAPHLRRKLKTYISPKLIWLKLKLLPDEIFLYGAIGVQRESQQQPKILWFPTILGYGAPSFRKHFRQKEVYLSTISDDCGLRIPVIQKTFSPKRGIP